MIQTLIKIRSEYIINNLSLKTINNNYLKTLNMYTKMFIKIFLLLNQKHVTIFRKRW